MDSPPLDEFALVGGPVPSVVMLPGWATDSRIFEGLFPGVPSVGISGTLYVSGFVDRLALFLEYYASGPVTIFGWSLGGFLAAEFAVRYPYWVRRLILAGVRRRYPPSGVEFTRSALSDNRRTCLTNFHAQCFLPSHMKEYRRFRLKLQKEYIFELDEEELFESLDYLEKAVFPTKFSLSRPVKIIHGGRDTVAPAAEAKELASSIDGAEFYLLPDAPHAVFLDEGFSALLSDD